MSFLKLPVFVRTAVIGFLTLASSAGAATVTGNGNQLDNNVPPLGADGYFFPYLDPTGGATVSGSDNGHGTDATVLPSYVSNLTINATRRYTSGDDNTAYSDIVLNGTPYNTGLAYLNSGVDATVATITLGATVPAAGFQLGILGDNADGGGHSGSWTVTASNGVTQNTVGAVATNNFYLYNITNLSPGETITISAGPGTAALSEIGGLTFDSVPEPTSLSLLGCAAMLLGRGVRSRRAR